MQSPFRPRRVLSSSLDGAGQTPQEVSIAAGSPGRLEKEKQTCPEKKMEIMLVQTVVATVVVLLSSLWRAETNNRTTV